jgi:hypothetical protein
LQLRRLMFRRWCRPSRRPLRSFQQYPLFQQYRLFQRHRLFQHRRLPRPLQPKQAYQRVLPEDIPSL